MEVFVPSMPSGLKGPCRWAGSLWGGNKGQRCPGEAAMGHTGWNRLTAVRDGPRGPSCHPQQAQTFLPPPLSLSLSGAG